MELNLPKKRTIANPAAPWKRTASFFVDLLIIQFIIIGPFSGILETSLPQGSLDANYQFFSTNGLSTNTYIVLFSIFILIYAYFVIFEWHMRQTPGKLIFGLRLAPLDKKEEITLNKVLLRNIAAIPIFPISLLWIVDPIYLFLKGNRFSDTLTKTQILEDISV